MLQRGAKHGTGQKATKAINIVLLAADNEQRCTIYSDTPIYLLVRHRISLCKYKYWKHQSKSTAYSNLHNRFLVIINNYHRRRHFIDLQRNLSETIARHHHRRHLVDLQRNKSSILICKESHLMKFGVSYLKLEAECVGLISHCNCLTESKYMQ